MDIEQLQKLLNVSSNIKWSKHCLERMQERDISIADVKSCLQTGEIIEEYPDDFPHPSCLILGHTKENKILHIVVGSDSNSLFFITAYFPSTDKFEKDFKTRNVPCEECEQCGEKYYSDEVAEQVESLVNMAKQLMQEIAVIDYSKAA